jgi:hypothetical protein
MGFCQRALLLCKKMLLVLRLKLVTVSRVSFLLGIWKQLYSFLIFWIFGVLSQANLFSSCTFSVSRFGPTMLSFSSVVWAVSRWVGRTLLPGHVPGLRRERFRQERISNDDLTSLDRQCPGFVPLCPRWCLCYAARLPQTKKKSIHLFWRITAMCPRFCWVVSKTLNCKKI